MHDDVTRRVARGLCQCKARMLVGVGGRSCLYAVRASARCGLTQSWLWILGGWFRRHEGPTRRQCGASGHASHGRLTKVVAAIEARAAAWTRLSGRARESCQVATWPGLKRVSRQGSGLEGVVRNSARPRTLRVVLTRRARPRGRPRRPAPRQRRTAAVCERGARPVAVNRSAELCAPCTESQLESRDPLLVAGYQMTSRRMSHAVLIGPRQSRHMRAAIRCIRTRRYDWSGPQRCAALAH